MRRLNHPPPAAARHARAAENAPLARSAVANVLRAAARDVKPADKRDYRTSSADCAHSSQNARNTPGASTEFFSRHPDPDSPRTPHGERLDGIPAHGIAGVGAGIARGGTLSLAPTADNAGWPATATSDGPPVDSPRCNTEPADGRRESGLHNLSADIAAAAAWIPAVASRTVANKLKSGPREVLLPDGQVSEPSRHLTPRRFFLASVHYLNSYANQPVQPLPERTPRRGPRPPRFTIRAIGPAKPRNWPHSKPRATQVRAGVASESCSLPVRIIV